jgi:hypothetical protein
MDFAGKEGIISKVQKNSFSRGEFYGLIGLFENTIAGDHPVAG